jgi:hypothetical protein
MQNRALSILAFLAFSTFAGLAMADVAPRCRCETPGTPVSGGAAAAFAVAGASVVMLARKRNRKS